MILMTVDYINEMMRIRISDSGPGFPEKELKQVFKKFYKVNNKKSGSLGLGLSIAKGFVEAHGGIFQ